MKTQVELLKECCDIKDAACVKYQKRIAELEEENKELKEKLSEITMVADDEKQSIEHILELEEEKKNLRAYADNLDSENDNQAIEIEELKKENKKLKKYYDRDKEELMESCYSLAKENDKLKSDLEECECSFWFENDEVWFWKREYKRLKKWVKDHCNWYWNLFPEDEMKRQWKKADKKRK